jgi:hypothetical protein
MPRCSRPAGVTLVSLGLLCISLSALVNLGVWTWLRKQVAFPPESPAAALVNALTGPLFIPIAGAYGLAALIAAAAVWLMRPWMTLAFATWSVAALAFCSWFLWSAPTVLIWGGFMAGAAFVVVVAILLWLIYRYLRRVASGGARAAV